MKFLACFRLVLVLIQLVNTLNVDKKAKSVLGVIQHKNKPIKVELLVKCWEKSDIIKFSNIFFENNILVSLSNFNHLEKDINRQHHFFIVDYFCYNSSEVFAKNNEQFLQYPYKWLIFIENYTDLPQQLPIFINSRIYLLQTKAPHILTSPYLIKNSTSYKYNLLGTWEDDNYNSPVAEIVDYEHRVNQEGLIVNTTGVLLYNRSTNHFDDFRYLTEDAYTKQNYFIFRHIMDIMNISANITWWKSWGVLISNTSKYTDMLGQMQEGAAEFCITMSYITKDRLDFVNYIAHPVQTNSRFIYRLPPLSAVSNILTMSFDSVVWIALALLILLIFIVLLVITKMEWNFLDNSTAITDAKVLQANAMEVVQFQIGTICQQGIEAEPRSVSGRLITFVSLLSFLFFYTAYSACIVALLQSSSDSISTLEHILQSKMQVAGDQIPYTRFYFQLQKGQVEEELYKQRLNKSEAYIPIPVGVERLRTEFFAYHSERNNIYRLILNTFKEEEKCGLREIMYINMVDPYVPVKKRSVYSEILLMAYSRIQETGLSTRVYLRTYATKPKCTKNGGNFGSVGLFDIYFAVLVYITGISIAFSMFIIEYIFKKLSKK